MQPSPTQPAPTVLEVCDLVKAHGRGETAVQALRGVSLSVAAGEWCAIMGPSGCGKTTLLHCCAGLSEVDGGQVLLAGQDLGRLNDRARSRLRRQQLGMVFQAFNLVPTLDALDNVALPLVLDGVAESRAREQARALIERVGLAERAGHLPGQLSGGEQQRVAIARALVADAPLILADEPTGSLDRRSGEAVGSLLRRVAGDGQRAVVMVTHDPAVAAWADRVLIMVDGQVVDDRRPAGDAAQIAEAVHGAAIATLEAAQS